MTDDYEFEFSPNIMFGPSIDPRSEPSSLLLLLTGGTYVWRKKP